MTKEEMKQWLRTQIDSSIKIQDHYNMNVFYLCYNNSYIRALKLSTITGQPVNENNFKGGEQLFWFDAKNKEFWYYSIIRKYLNENYSIIYYDQYKLLEEVLGEYDEYKGYTGYKQW